MEPATAAVKREAEDLGPQRSHLFICAPPHPEVTPQGWGWSGLEAAEPTGITALTIVLTPSSSGTACHSLVQAQQRMEDSFSSWTKQEPSPSGLASL